MSSPRAVRVTFTVLAIYCFIGPGQGGIAANPQPERTESQNTLAGYLGRAAFKLDCYFTIEEMTQEEGGDNWITEHSVRAGNDPSSIEKMIGQLSAQLKGVHIYRSKENPAVVHFIDERFDKEKEYALPKCVAVNFHGTLDKLVEKLQRTSFENLHPQFSVGGFSGGIGS
jgi:hypothetical protein